MTSDDLYDSKKFFYNSKSYIIWTNFDAEQQNSHLVQVHANPEVVRDRTDQSGSFNVHAITMTNTNESMTEYWALAADYKNKVKLTSFDLKWLSLIKILI